MKIKSLTFLFAIIFGSATAVWAQPVNDECSNAIELTDVSNFCSEVNAYTLAGATASPQTLPSCWPLMSQANDIWFEFTMPS